LLLVMKKRSSTKKKNDPCKWDKCILDLNWGKEEKGGGFQKENTQICDGQKECWRVARLVTEKGEGEKSQ